MRKAEAVGSLYVRYLGPVDSIGYLGQARSALKMQGNLPNFSNIHLLRECVFGRVCREAGRDDVSE